MKRRRPSVVIDTNVAVAASGRASQASPDCEAACRQQLLAVTDGRRRLVLDDGFEIFTEYRSQLSLGGQPGVGDLFVKWVHDHQFDRSLCERVVLTPHPVRAYEEFPDDPSLLTFDPADRKFAAAARTSDSGARVLNALDSDWWDHRTALARNGIHVEFVCPDEAAKWERHRPRSGTGPGSRRAPGGSNRPAPREG